jgi:hypothetical protein
MGRLGYAPGERLLVQGNVTDVVEQREPPRLRENFVALFLIRLLQSLTGEVVDLRVAIAAGIIAAPIPSDFGSP